MDLTKLYLASNRLLSIPGDVEKLSSLVILDLHDNALQSIPGEIGNLEHLRKLDLNHNRLRKLPEGLFEATRSLASLSVNNNELNHIGEGIRVAIQLTRSSLWAVFGATFRDLMWGILLYRQKIGM